MGVYYLADERCTACAGFGRRIAKRSTHEYCGCVLKRVSRIVLDRLRTHEQAPPHWNFHRWTRDAEFAADVLLTAKRTLDEKQLIIYRSYLLDERPWFEVEPKTKLGRGNFFHEVYRVEERLGRAFLDSPVFPPQAYFSGMQDAEGVSLIYRMFSGGDSMPRFRPSQRRAFAAAA